jgi:hypothetical protein
MAVFKDLNTALFKRFLNKEIEPTLEFDEVSDELLILFGDLSKNYIAVDVDSHLSLLYYPGDKEVIGVRIENFEYSFLKKFPDIGKIWFVRDDCKEGQTIFQAEEKIEVRKEDLAWRVSKMAYPKVGTGGLFVCV